jgi:hypothetical protein
MHTRRAEEIRGRCRNPTPIWARPKQRRTAVSAPRTVTRDSSPLREMRRLIEYWALRRGFDGVGEFGLDLFPLKTPVGGYQIPPAGRGINWAGQATTLALLYPGPDGPVATERYEMLREGLQLCEAILFVRKALAEDKLSGALKERADRYLHVPDKRGLCERDEAFEHGRFRARYMQTEEDAILFELAGEAASAMEAGP